MATGLCYEILNTALVIEPDVLLRSIFKISVNLWRYKAISLSAVDVFSSYICIFFLHPFIDYTNKYYDDIVLQNVTYNAVFSSTLHGGSPDSVELQISETLAIK